MRLWGASSLHGHIRSLTQWVFYHHAPHAYMADESTAEESAGREGLID